jgi:hypothetical protein
MIRVLLSGLMIGLLMTMTGCPAVVVGAGAGAGIYTFTAGDLTRTYQARYDKTMAASLDALREMKITILEKPAGDAIKSVVKAQRSDGTPVTLTISMVAPNITEVSVRSGVVGYWDLKVSKLIHANIAQRLQ